MEWGLSVVTAPASEPISTADAKTHLRVDASDDDSYIDALVSAARSFVEQYTHRALITQTLKLTLDRFPWGNRYIQLPRAPAQSVTSIQYIDCDGVLQTWDSSNYSVDIKRQPGRLYPNYNQCYPSTRNIEEAVQITYVAGYGNSGTDIPTDLIHAMKLIIGQFYEIREASCPMTLNELPFGARALLDMHKLWYWGPFGVYRKVRS